ncbi:MAG: ChbG/HpnK family deacetylase [Armatimonadota bacterium]
MNLSFVYPVYNEIENLPRLVPETQRIAAGMAPEYEVVLVDDGSADGSGAFIDQLAASHPQVRPVHHSRNRGLGAAVRSGLSSATKDLVLYMDSDFPVSVEDARAALHLLGDDTDMLIGYRLGRAEGPRRELMSWTYNRLIRWTFGLRVRDVNFAFKLIRRSLLEQMRLRSEGSFIDAELLLEAARLGARIREVGIQYHSRTAGVSTAAGYRVVLRIFGEMWRYWLRRRLGRVGPASLIVNADDFGLCEPVNRGIAEAFDRGIVTSASLLAGGEAFDQAVMLARRRPELDLGVHLSLTQTRPVAPPDRIPTLMGAAGRLHPDWRSFLSHYVRRRISRAEVEIELRAQLERARASGLPFSHLDGHQHLHALPGVLSIVVRLAQEYGLGAIRFPWQRRAARGGGAQRAAQLLALQAACALGRSLVTGNGILVADDFRGFAEAGAWHQASLADTIFGLDSGLTEICCHPGADDGIDSSLGWRYHWEQELGALTSPEVSAAVEQSGVRLTTYREALAAQRPAISGSVRRAGGPDDLTRL